MTRAQAHELAPVVVRGQPRPQQRRPEAGNTERLLSSGQTTRMPVDAGDLTEFATLAPGVIGIAGMARGDVRWSAQEATRIASLAVPNNGGEGDNISGGMLTLTSHLDSSINELRGYHSTGATPTRTSRFPTAE